MTPEKIVKKTVIKVKPLPADRVTKQDKDLEKGMMESLEKEDFYGKKKAEERLAKSNKRAIDDARSDAAVKKMNALIAAKLRAKK